MKMIESLLEKEITRRPASVRFNGRVLFLTEDPALIRSQLEGADLEWDRTSPGHKLRDNISTDEITPAYICYYFDETLGDFPYLGLKAGEEFPIVRGSVKSGNFVASVSGMRRGKGSSREQSPYAEMCAGIGLVVAENIERIYNENCQNLGILTTTDFSILDRVRNGEEIPLSAFTRETGGITREIIEHGGLFNYNVARLQGKVTVPPPATASDRPMTLAEKIFARHWVTDLRSEVTGIPAVQPGDEGFFRTDLRFSHEYVTPMAAIFFRDLVGEDEKVVEPDSVKFFRDHLTFLPQVMSEERKKQGLLDIALQLEYKQRDFAKQQGIRLHAEIPGDVLGSEGICHSIVLEQYALPGQIIIGSDSHTPHSGAVGCVAFGVGTTAIFNSWITRDVRATVPKSVRVIIRGKKPANLTAKDFMLAVLRDPYVKEGKAIGKVIEYAGEAVEALSIDERATMTNMAAEVGGFTGITAPDAKTVEWLIRQRGLERAVAEKSIEGLFSDPMASYDHVIDIDAAELRPMIALPGDPGNGIFIDETAAPVKVDIAYAGSCTGGKKEDMDMYAEVLRQALEQGKKVSPGVEFFLQYGSQETKQYCIEKGYVEIFQKAGAQIVEPSCGACINAGPGVSVTKEQVTISAINRNFPGRSGPGQMYLASPYTVAASAVAGFITEYQPGEPVTH